MAPFNTRVQQLQRHHADSLSSSRASVFISSAGSLYGPDVFAIPRKHSQSDPELASTASEAASGFPDHNSRCLRYRRLIPWLPLVTITMINVLMGLNMYSLGFFFAEITQTLGTSQGSGGLMSALQLAASNFLSVFLIGPVNRWDCRTVSAVGCLVLLSGLLCSCFAPSITVLYFTYGIVPGIGMCVVYLETITLSQKLFVNHRALLTSITYMGYSIGSLVSPSLEVYLLETYGWRGALLIHTAILSHVLIFVMTFPKTTPNEIHKSPSIICSNETNVETTYKGGSLVSKDEEEANDELEVKVKAEEGSKWTFEGGTRMFAEIPDENNGLKNSLEIENLTDDIDENKLDSESRLVKVKAEEGSKWTFEGGTRMIAEIPDENNGLKNSLEIENLTDEIDENKLAPESRLVKVKAEDGSKWTFEGGTRMIAEIPDENNGLKNSLEIENLTDDIVENKLDPESTAPAPDRAEETIYSATAPAQGRGCMALLTQSMDCSLMRDVKFVLYNVSTFLVRIPSAAFIVLLPSVLLHNGYTLHQAAALASIVSLTNTCVRPLVGLIADHVNRYLFVFIGAVLCAVANALLLFGSVYWVAVTACAMHGVYMAIWNTLVAVVLVDLVGMDNIARSYGINAVFCGIGTLIGPSVAGWLYDIRGDYLVAFCSMAAVGAIGSSFMVIIYVLSRKSSPNVDSSSR